MTYEVVALRRADADVRHITRWIAGRSVQGANAWLEAYDNLLTRLAESADRFAEAAECTIPLKEALFSTSHGRPYRAVFMIARHQVRILRIRGHGQPPLQPDELL